MIKHFAFAFSTIFGFASVSLAASPFDAKAFSDAPSVLVKADVAPPAPIASEKSAVAHESASIAGDKAATEPISEEGKIVDAAPMHAVESTPMVTSESAPVYRTVRPSRKQSGGLFSELIELERRKNAWLRKNILGR